MVKNLILRRCKCIDRDILFSFFIAEYSIEQESKFALFWELYWKHLLQIPQLIYGSTLIWVKLFDCFSYITFPPDQMTFIYVIIQ